MPQTNRLFFVRADNLDGESLDLLVVAEDEAQAETSWRSYYNLDIEVRPTWVGSVPGVAPVASCEVGAIDWAAIRME